MDTQYCPRLPRHLMKIHRRLSSAHRTAQMIKAVCFCQKQTSSNLRAFKLIFHDIVDGVNAQVVADHWTLQCEHVNRELWLYIAYVLLLQCDLELNKKTSEIVQWMLWLLSDIIAECFLKLCILFGLVIGPEREVSSELCSLPACEWAGLCVVLCVWVWNPVSVDLCCLWLLVCLNTICWQWYWISLVKVPFLDLNNFLATLNKM